MRYIFLFLAIFNTGAVSAQTHDSTEIFQCFAGEEMPEFPGGQNKLIAYLAENIRYPDVAQEEDLRSRCTVRFIVNEDGCISDLKVVKSISSSVDEEVMKAVSRMPCWKPGKLNGIPVRATFFLPVTICLQ